MPAGTPAAPAAAGKRKTGSEKLNELERAEGLLKRGRISKEAFDILVAELLPVGGEPVNATTSAAAGLLELASKKAKGGAGEEGAAAAGGEEAPQVAQGAPEIAPVAEAPAPEVGLEGAVIPEPAEGPAAEEGAPQEEQPAGDKRKRTTYKWKYEVDFDTKEKVGPSSSTILWFVHHLNPARSLPRRRRPATTSRRSRTTTS